MDHFQYRSGLLHAEDVPLPEIAAVVGTPVYVYSSATLLRHYALFEQALSGLDHLVCYSVKASSNVAILKLLADAGHTYEQEGALWFKAEEFGDERDRVLRKSDGYYTYLAGDFAYHLNKLNRLLNTRNRVRRCT